MASISLDIPDAITLVSGTQMFFEEIDGVHYQTTRFDGDDTHPFVVSPHWHEYHDEVITVIEGVMDVYADEKWRRYSANPDVVIRIRREIVHSFKSVAGTGPMAFRETAVAYGALVDDPASKAIFFRDVFQKPNPSFLHVIRALLDGDTFVKLPYLPKFVGVMFTGFEEPDLMGVGNAVEARFGPELRHP